MSPILAHAQDYQVRVSRPGLKPLSDSSTQPKPSAEAPVLKPAVAAVQALTSADFGAVAVGSSAQRTFDVVNQGQTAATGVSVAITGAAVSLVESACGTVNSSITLAPGASCQVAVSYAPTAEGPLTGAALQVQGSFTNATLTQPLTGSGYRNPVSFLTGTLGSAWGANTYAGTNTSLSADGLVWTVGARPSGQGGKAAYYLSGASIVGGRQYAEMSSSTSSAWLMVQGASTGTGYGVAIDGPGCQAGPTFTASCTPNPGSWANTRIGVLLDYSASTITFYYNGREAVTMRNVTMNEGFILRAHDRDVPQSATTRTYRIFTAPNSWQYAPANVMPLRK